MFDADQSLSSRFFFLNYPYIFAALCFQREGCDLTKNIRSTISAIPITVTTESMSIKGCKDHVAFDLVSFSDIILCPICHYCPLYPAHISSSPPLSFYFFVPTPLPFLCHQKSDRKKKQNTFIPHLSAAFPLR